MEAFRHVILHSRLTMQLGYVTITYLAKVSSDVTLLKFALNNAIWYTVSMQFLCTMCISNGKT